MKQEVLSSRSRLSSARAGVEIGRSSAAVGSGKMVVVNGHPRWRHQDRVGQGRQLGAIASKRVTAIKGLCRRRQDSNDGLRIASRILHLVIKLRGATDDHSSQLRNSR